MRARSFNEEAKACRRQAALYAGRPESHFLLKIAHSFEELAGAPVPRQSAEIRPEVSSLLIILMFWLGSAILVIITGLRMSSCMEPERYLILLPVELQEARA